MCEALAGSVLLGFNDTSGFLQISIVNTVSLYFLLKVFLQEKILAKTKIKQIYKGLTSLDIFINLAHLPQTLPTSNTSQPIHNFSVPPTTTLLIISATDLDSFPCFKGQMLKINIYFLIKFIAIVKIMKFAPNPFGLQQGLYTISLLSKAILILNLEAHQIHQDLQGLDGEEKQVRAIISS